MPNVVAISGANGAGKSTLAPFLLRDTFGILEYVNADTIAQGLSAFAPEKFAFEAGRVMLKQLKNLALQKADFAFETTLSSKFYGKWLRDLQQNGYEFHLIFLYLQSADLAVERVRERVRMGGHNIPEDVIRRRYENGLRNFYEIYQPIADSWRVIDVSKKMPLDVAFGDKIETRIIEENIWKRIQPK
jgi:predicted ABC-type ATPase